MNSETIEDRRRRDRDRRWRDMNRDKVRAMNRASYARHHATRVALAEQRRDADRDSYRAQSRARYAVKKALERGVLERGPCEHAAAGDCTGPIEAHHNDYARRLEVRWLCRRHHMMLHSGALLTRFVQKPTLPSRPHTRARN